MARRRPTEPTVNPARGAVLVVVAVLIGLFLLRNGLDTSEVVTSQSDGRPSSDSDDGTDEADEGTDTTDEGTDEGTTTTIRPPAEVATIVLNGGAGTGAAGRWSEALTAFGYTLTNPSGANADASTPTTLVYFAPEFEAEAAALVSSLGLPATVVPAALPTTPPGPIAGANVVLVLGGDLSGVTPPTAPADGEATDGEATDEG